MKAWELVVDDMCEPFIIFKDNGLGEFQFAYFQGLLDYHICQTEGQSRLVFSWEGYDELEPLFGGGYAKIIDNCLQGYLFIHLGDISKFMAHRC